MEGNGGEVGNGVGVEAEVKKPAEGEREVKSKRKMKTASQLEVLEKTYAAEAYPSDALRAELSVQLGLSDRQLQMWFCHRRLKDRKGLGSGKRSLKDSTAAASPVVVEEVAVSGNAGNEVALGSGLVSSAVAPPLEPWRLAPPRVGTAVARISSDYAELKRYHGLQLSVEERRAIASVEAQLSEPLREDGPILGMEFDPLPPGAFGAPIGPATVSHHKQNGWGYDARYERPEGAVRPVHEYQFLPEKPTVRTESYERAAPSYHYSGLTGDSKNSGIPSISAGNSVLHGSGQSPADYGLTSQMPTLNLLTPLNKQGPSPKDYDADSRKGALVNVPVEAHLSIHPVRALDNPLLPSDRDNPLLRSDRRLGHSEDVFRTERKRKSEEARIAREVEAHEKRIRKELKKQDILRRKREEQLRKEMERQDRERRKEEERLLREKQREEERYLREQRRELERREKFLLKESIRAEKMRQKEETRRIREAARLKAARERAIARRIAKESTELIEDERLELMELAAFKKGLPSIASLDIESLQDLHLLRGSLPPFPPKSVQLKRPFSIEPWCHSDENIGNLLMVWRFLITFADVLNIWPFTIDEFVQALHDYDARLLGEVHVSILKLIIKDIEDVGRTPSNSLGANLNSVVNPVGGHPHIVEGAYAWGFDIRSWQHHLNLLSWPEILRQLALSAGYGPQLKKNSVEPASFHEDESNDCEDIISIIRNGVAAENAFAKMQRRGLSNLRRSRHRLTPGTVKFAAFHILSLEGSRGLNILEVADRIQKSGLRDLTTSKTPEASIAAALSRDTKLFERTAPSTYCVRPAFRKDPADAEAILSAARERVREFKNEFMDVEEAEDAERDDDSESDSVEDPEVDDLGSEYNFEKEVKQRNVDNDDTKAFLVNGKGNDFIDQTNLKTPENGLEKVKEDSSLKHTGDTSKEKSNGTLDQSVDSGLISNEAVHADQQDTDIDESNPGEPWVQSLVEGEYSNLSVEERLNALVALVSVANEGNTIRVVLEERLEAASALKKQMWAEAQVDKRRMREEFIIRVSYPSQLGAKLEPNLNGLPADVRQSPAVTVGEGNNGVPTNLALQQASPFNQQNHNSFSNVLPVDGNLQVQDIACGPDTISLQQVGFAADKSQMKAYIGYKAEQMYMYRSLPLGQDRRRNRYWQFATSASRNDPGCGRIFVELNDVGWRLIDSEEVFDALKATLDACGVRESYLHSMLHKIEASFKESLRNAKQKVEHSVKGEVLEIVSGPDSSAVDDSPRSTVCATDSEVSEASTSFSIQLGRNQSEKIDALRRYEDFEKWMWKECSSSSVLCATKHGEKRSPPLLGACNRCHEIYFLEDDYCSSCGGVEITSKGDSFFPKDVAKYQNKLKIVSNTNWHKSFSSSVRIRLLKAKLALIEASIPTEAFESVWTDDCRRMWYTRLYSSSSAGDLLQVLTILESVLKRDFLSSNYEITRELFGSNFHFGSSSDISLDMEAIAVLPFIPHTTAAVTLRLLEFDSAISYTLHQKAAAEKDDEAGNFIKLPTKYTAARNSQNHGVSEDLYLNEPLEENWVDSSLLASSSRGRAARGRGQSRNRCGKSELGVINSRSESGKKNNKSNSGKSEQGLVLRGRQRARGGRKRGQRSVRSRQRKAKKPVLSVKNKLKERIPEQEKTPEIMVEDEWDDGENSRLPLDDVENISSSERSDYDDESGQAQGYEYNNLADYTTLNNKPNEFLEGSDDNVEVNEDVDGDDDNDDDDDDDDGDGEDEEDEGDGGVEEERGASDVDGFLNEDSDEEGMEAGEDEYRNMDIDQYSEYTSSSSSSSSSSSDYGE